MMPKFLNTRLLPALRSATLPAPFAALLAGALPLLLAGCASSFDNSPRQPLARAPSACFGPSCCDAPASLQFEPYRLYCRARAEDAERRSADASATFRDAVAAAQAARAAAQQGNAQQAVDANAVLCYALNATARRAELSPQDSLLKLEDSYAACQASYGADSDVAAQALYDAADQRLAMGEAALVLAPLERVLALARQNENAGLEAQATDGLGRQAGLAGDSEKERRLLLEAVELKKPVYGEASREVATTYFRLGRSYTRAGDGVPAREWYLRAIGILIDKLGAANPLTMEVMEEFANSHADDGNFKQAQIMFDMLLPKAIQTYGARDERTMVIVNSLASTMERQKRYTKALALFERSLKIRRVTMPDSVRHGATALNAARTKRLLSNCSGATTYAREAMRVSKAVQAAQSADPKAEAFVADTAAFATACKIRPAPAPAAKKRN